MALGPEINISLYDEKKAKRRLTFSFAFLTLLITSIGFVSFFAVNAVRSLNQNIYDHPLTVGFSVREINTHVTAIHKTIRDVVLAHSPTVVALAKAEISERESEIEKLFAIVKERFLGDLQWVQEATDEFKSWGTIREKVLNLIQENRIDEAQQISVNESADKVVEIYRAIKKLQDYADNKADEFRSNSDEQASGFSTIIVLSSAFCILVSIIISLLLRKYIINILSGINSYSSEISESAWLKSSNVEILSLMQESGEIKSMSSKVLSTIARKTNASVAVLYIASDEKNLKLAATYAVSDEENLPHIIPFGEGLAGQAAVEKEIKILKPVPQGYLKINSGLLNTEVEQILAIPLIIDKEVKGVIEIGNLRALNEVEMEYLKMIQPNVAITLQSLKSKEETRLLLQKFQELAEELQTQQEELRVINEELEEKNRILKDRK